MPRKPKLHELAVTVPPGTILDAPTMKAEFVMGKQFATGGFGQIYTCKKKGETVEYVVKVEPHGNGPLFTEISVFQRILKKDMIDNYSKQKKINVPLPWLITAGTFDYNGNKLRYMIMPKYETSLEAIRTKNGGCLSASDTWKVVSSMLSALEYLHHNKYVHADIKAANILVEKKTNLKSAVLVDFGLARLATSNVDKPEKKRAHNGTAIFTSIDAHRGCNPSYRGDIEILAYNIIFWLTGKLPWQPLENSPDKVYEAKQKFTDKYPDELKKVLTSAALITAVKEFFKVAIQTGYTEQVNFSSLLKATDKAASGASEASSSEPEPTLPKTKVAPRKKIQSEEAKPKEEDIQPDMSQVTTRRRVTRKRLSPAVSEEKDEKDSLKENRDAQKKVKTKPIPPSVKTDAEKLRQNVPGLRNLPKGRRSIIVNQITKKYQKMATSKSTNKV